MTRYVIRWGGRRWCLICGRVVPRLRPHLHHPAEA